MVTALVEVVARLMQSQIEDRSRWTETGAETKLHNST